jgi:exosome complex RNA-binding protein Rrp4
MISGKWLSGVALFGLLLSGCAAAPHPQQCPNPKDVTPGEVKTSLAYVRAHLPNTVFMRAEPSKSAPGLVKLVEANADGSPGGVVYFDPRTNYLIIGLVIDFENKSMHIAGGKSMLGTNRIPEPEGASHE